VGNSSNSSSYLYAHWILTYKSVYIYDGDSKKITSDSHTHTNDYSIGLNVMALRELGYTKFTITYKVQLRDQGGIPDPKGDYEFWLDIDNSSVVSHTSGAVSDNDWIDVNGANGNISIDNITNASTCRIGMKKPNGNDWWFNQAYVYITAVK
jgi:hypothetical protein